MYSYGVLTVEEIDCHYLSLATGTKIFRQSRPPGITPLSTYGTTKSRARERILTVALNRGPNKTIIIVEMKG